MDNVLVPKHNQSYCQSSMKSNTRMRMASLPMQQKSYCPTNALDYKTSMRNLFPFQKTIAFIGNSNVVILNPCLLFLLLLMLNWQRKHALLTYIMLYIIQPISPPTVKYSHSLTGSTLSNPVSYTSYTAT